MQYDLDQALLTLMNMRVYLSDQKLPAMEDGRYIEYNALIRALDEVNLCVRLVSQERWQRRKQIRGYADEMPLFTEA